MARTPRSEAEVLASIPGARARAAEADAAEPRAVSAAYDTREERVRVELRNGCAVLVPVEFVPGLEGASPEQLAGVSVEDGGAALRWEELDADASLPGLVARVLDVRAWAARYLGQSTSEAKARAARENGKKGGRPRKHPAARGEG